MQRVPDTTETTIAADHDDLAVELLARDEVQDVVTADTRHDEIQKHDIERLLLQDVHRCLTTQCLFGLVPM